MPPRELVPGVLVARSRFWMTNAGVVWGERGAALLVDPGVLPDGLVDEVGADEAGSAGDEQTHEGPPGMNAVPDKA